MSYKRKIVFFTGAGISKESGISTFRDAHDGLWNNHRIEDVATPSGWKKNRKTVLEFYNQRRREIAKSKPNTAHLIIAELQHDFEVVVITQNVDDLHERAGSELVIHLHGEINKSRSSVDPSLIYVTKEDVKIGDVCKRGSQLRPYVIWFGEQLEDSILASAKEHIQTADAIVIVGSSMLISPACDLPFLSKESAPIYYVDPSDVNFHVPSWKEFFHIQEVATSGMQMIKEKIYQ